MSFFESISKKAKLNAAIKQTAEARNIGGHAADQLFKKVYQDYAEVVANEPLIAEALYNWGLALLHQARAKSGELAANIYQDAIAKFSFCLTIEQAYLAAALDGGFAYMELARIKRVKPDDSLYEMAKSYFEKANSIQAGAASYNLACIYALRNEKEACHNALEVSKNKGYLPIAADILADPDLESIRNHDWFVDFMESLNKKPEAVTEDAVVSENAADVPVSETAEVENVTANEEPVKDEADVTPFKAAADYTTVNDEDAPLNENADVAVESDEVAVKN
jgi:tetratricopeptide (TPR) repeat protein